MAIQIALAEADSGIGATIAAAYVRIVIYTHDIKNDTIMFAVEYHYNAQAKNQGRQPIRGASYTVTGAQLSGTGGTRSQLYAYLMTLPEFATAVEV